MTTPITYTLWENAPYVCIESLVYLYLEAYRDMPWYGEASWHDALHYLKWLRVHHTFFELAITLRQPIGFIVADARWKSRWGSGGHIHEWVVHPRWRQQGIGKTLFQHAIRHLLQNNHWRIILWSGENNTIANHFYRKMGFQPAGKYRHWIRWVKEFPHKKP